MIFPWYARWVALAALVGLACLYTGIKVAGHYQDRLAAINAVGQAQIQHTKAVEVKQKEVTKNVQRETSSAIARSDAYWLHQSSSERPVPSVAGPASSPETTAEKPSPDPVTCDLADGAADAILVLGWQKFYSDLQAAQRQ